MSGKVDERSQGLDMAAAGGSAALSGFERGMKRDQGLSDVYWVWRSVARWVRSWED